MRRWLKLIKNFRITNFKKKSYEFIFKNCHCDSRLCCRFFLGRKTIKVEEKVTFVKGETIRDTIVINEPTFVEIPTKPKYIYKYDTIVVDNIQYISEKVDTSAIIQDYILMRTYDFNVFNSSTLGTNALGNMPATTKIRVPRESHASYISATGWSALQSQIFVI